MFRYLILGLLRRHGVQHGYAIMKAYREQSGNQVSTGNFYRELQRLMVDGMVRAVDNPAGADPRRAPYEITELGATTFDAWLSEARATSVGDYQDELSTRTFFLFETAHSVCHAVLDSWREQLWIEGKVLERTRDLARSRVDGPLSVRVLLLTRRLKHISADLEFLGEFRTAYDQLHARSGREEEPREAQVPSRPPVQRRVRRARS